MKKILRVTQIKSKFGRLPSHIACVHGLGLRHIHHTVELQDTPSIRGMITKIYYMLKVEELEVEDSHAS